MPGINSDKLFWAMMEPKDGSTVWTVLMVGTLSQICGRVRALDRLHKWLNENVVLPGDIPFHDYVHIRHGRIGEVVVQPYDKHLLPEYDGKYFSKVKGLQIMGKRYDFTQKEVS